MCVTGGQMCYHTRLGCKPGGEEVLIKMLSRGRPCGAWGLRGLTLISPSRSHLSAERKPGLLMYI